MRQSSRTNGHEYPVAIYFDKTNAQHSDSKKKDPMLIGKNQKIHDSNSSHLMSKTYNLYIISVRCCLKVSLDGQPLPQYDVFKKIKLKNEKLF